MPKQLIILSVINPPAVFVFLLPHELKSSCAFNTESILEIFIIKYQSQIVLLFFTGSAHILGLVTCRASRGVMLFLL